MLIEGHRVDGSSGFHVAQTGHTVGIGFAHGLHHAAHGVNPLVVQFGFDGGDEVLLFAFHKGFAETAIFQDRLEEQFPDEVDHGCQDLVTGDAEAVFDEAAAEAGGLIVADTTDQCADGCAVKLIQPEGNVPEVPVFFGAAEQNRGEQCVHGGLFSPHGTHDLESQAALFEPAVRVGPQGHARHQVKFFCHRFSLWPVLQAGFPPIIYYFFGNR